MKFSEMRAQMSGLPEGFSGKKVKWQEVREAFTIVKLCMTVQSQKTESGELLVSPVTGEVYMDRNLVMVIRTEKGEDLLVYTNSPKLVPVFRQQIPEERKPDEVSRYGADIYILDPPEGKLRFTTMKHKFGSKGEMDVAYLEEAE